MQQSSIPVRPLYRLSFHYPESWSFELHGPEGVESQWFFLAEGRCTGELTGRFRGANHPRRRTDGTFCPDFQGVIETEDGATLFFDSHGYGRAYPPGRRQIVTTVTHLSADPRYSRLNDALCIATGEVRTSDSGTELVIAVSELIWQPPGE
jgi:hypothetical protein